MSRVQHRRTTRPGNCPPPTNKPPQPSVKPPHRHSSDVNRVCQCGHPLDRGGEGRWCSTQFVVGRRISQMTACASIGRLALRSAGAAGTRCVLVVVVPCLRVQATAGHWQRDADVPSGWLSGATIVIHARKNKDHTTVGCRRWLVTCGGGFSAREGCLPVPGMGFGRADQVRAGCLCDRLAVFYAVRRGRSVPRYFAL